jgi:subtilase family serine protease
MGSLVTPCRRWTLALCALTVLLWPATAQASNRWTVRNTAPDWASPSARAAAVPNSNRMVFSVWLGWRDSATLQTTLRSMYDPSSPSYHRWMSPEQFRAGFSPGPTQVAEVRSWLVKQGFSVIDVPENRLFVTASGTTAQVENAFNVNINLYHLNGQLVRAPSQDPTIPMPLAADVRAITGLDGALALTAPSHTLAVAPPPPPAGMSLGPCSRFWGDQTTDAFPNPYSPETLLPWIPCGYQPQQIMSAYGIDHLHRRGLDGRGQTIAITGAFFSPTLLADANRFSREFHLPPLVTKYNYTQVVAPGTLKYPRDDEETQSFYIEQALDVEWAHAVAPRAHIVYVGAANDAAGLDHAINTTIDRHLANIVSNSWGMPEAWASQGEINSLNEMFQQAAAEGIGVYFASGDNGDLDDAIGAKSVGFPDSSPWVTSVGGTSLGIGRHGQYLWESGWGTTNSNWNGSVWKPKVPGSFLGGSGGGVSHVFAQPWYQKGVVPSSVATWKGKLRRSEPDIAMDADPDTPVIFTQTYVKPDGHYTQIDSWVGGTSVAAPMTAALMSLMDERAHRAHGFANPGLYRLAGTVAFHDIRPTDSTLAVLRNTPTGNGGSVTQLRSIDHDSSLTTARGWDNVTGLGSPNAWWLSWLLR